MKKNADEPFQPLPAFVRAARETVQERDARRKADHGNGDDAREREYRQIVAQRPAAQRDGHCQHVDEDEQQSGGGGVTVGDIHPIQPAEERLCPFGARGDEQRKRHQHDVDRADDLPGIGAHEVFAPVVDRREDQPHGNRQRNAENNKEITGIPLH